MQSTEEVKFYLSTLTKPITWRLEASKTKLLEKSLRNIPVTQGNFNASSMNSAVELEFFYPQGIYASDVECV